MKPICGPVSFHIGTSTGSTVAMAMASKASKNVATPTMIRVLTCHHEVGSRSIRATTLSTALPGAAAPMLMVPSPYRWQRCYIGPARDARYHPPRPEAGGIRSTHGQSDARYEAADAVTALRAAVLVPVLLGIQRQFSEKRPGLPNLVQDRGRGRGNAHHARGGNVHCALFLPVRARRRNGRPLRQGGGGAAAQAR